MHAQSSPASEIAAALAAQAEAVCRHYLPGRRAPGPLLDRRRRSWLSRQVPLRPACTVPGPVNGNDGAHGRARRSPRPYPSTGNPLGDASGDPRRGPLLSRHARPQPPVGPRSPPTRTPPPPSSASGGPAGRSAGHTQRHTSTRAASGAAAFPLFASIRSFTTATGNFTGAFPALVARRHRRPRPAHRPAPHLARSGSACQGPRPAPAKGARPPLRLRRAFPGAQPPFHPRGRGRPRDRPLDHHRLPGRRRRSRAVSRRRRVPSRPRPPAASQLRGDNDPDGIQAAARLAERCEKSAVVCRVLIPRGNDFNDDLTGYGIRSLRWQLGSPWSR